MFRPALLIIALSTVLLSGCDMVGGALGIESLEKVAAAREADGKAIGAACRHAGRAIEDCYALNKRAEKASVFAGWRDMNDYMRENKIEAVAPQLTTQVAAAARDGSPKDAATKAADEDAKPTAKSDKTADKVVDKTTDKASPKSAGKSGENAKTPPRESAKAPHDS